MNSSITLTHNMEVAHRLLNLPGKCQQIHGHSMQVMLTFIGETNENGLFEGWDFADVKRKFRQYIDTTYDHHLLLNENDPWASNLAMVDGAHPNDEIQTLATRQLPGLVTCPGDPTTENLAQWICDWAREYFATPCEVNIAETGTNGAGYRRF